MANGSKVKTIIFANGQRLDIDIEEFGQEELGKTIDKLAKIHGTIKSISDFKDEIIEKERGD